MNLRSRANGTGHRTFGPYSTSLGLRPAMWHAHGKLRQSLIEAARNFWRPRTLLTSNDCQHHVEPRTPHLLTTTPKRSIE
eukprot:1077185-Amphidinium_carterae.1